MNNILTFSKINHYIRFQSLELNPLFHVKDLQLGQVREVGDIVDAVAGGIQL